MKKNHTSERERTREIAKAAACGRSLGRLRGAPRFRVESVHGDLHFGVVSRTRFVLPNGGILVFSNEHLSAKELNAKELRMRFLSDFAHMAFSRAYHQEAAAAALAEKLSIREAEVLR